MDKEEVDMLLEVERCKMHAEQNKKDIDALGNSLWPRMLEIETDIAELKTTSTKIYAYVAAATVAIMVLAWAVDHEGLFQ